MNGSAQQGETGPVILSVAYPYAPVGPEAVGGAEVVLSQIEAALGEHGFRSAVVAHHASRPAGRLYPVAVPPGEITAELRDQVEQHVQEALDRALREQPVALIHLHGLDFHRYRLPENIPVLVTLHLPPAWYPETIWSLPSQVHLLCVSAEERETCPPNARARIRVIENGVPLPERTTLRPAGRYALLLARICPEKNLHTGLDAAHRAGVPAVLAGDVFPYVEHQRYFQEEIEPRLTQQGRSHVQREAAVSPSADARFLGPVTGAAKTRLLTRAACLLLPSLAPETSSLVAMEALAAGIPVIAMASGAVPGIVDDGQTGFLIQPGPEALQQMADAIGRLPELSRAHCRRAAEQRFGLERMLLAYMDLYRLLARTVPEQTGSPTAHETGAEAMAPAHLRIDLEPEATEVRELCSAEALSAIADEWTELWEADAHATPFQHPAWLLPWWHQFGPDGTLHALCLRGRDSGSLNAFVPLYTLHAGLQGQMLLAGAGTSDYLDGLWRSAAASPALASQTLQHVKEQIHDWNSLSLTQLRGDSPLLRAAQQLGGGIRCDPAEPCSTIALHAPLPPKLEGNYRRYRRRAEALGALAFSVASSEQEALQRFADLEGLHRERWQQRGEAGVLSDPRVLAHHQEAIPALYRAGLLHLFTLTLDGRVLAVLYALADGAHRRQRSLYLYLIGVDIQHADLSPGTLLLRAVHEFAKNSGFHELDLLRGGEAYKRLWGVAERPTFSLQQQNCA